METRDLNAFLFFGLMRACSSSLNLARSHIYTHMYARVHMPNFGASNRFAHMNARAHTLQSLNVLFLLQFYFVNSSSTTVSPYLSCLDGLCSPWHPINSKDA